jgi:molecular chaperone DnaK (HSP70)
VKGVSLKKHFTELLKEKDKRDQQRFEAQTQGITAAMSAAEKAITKADNATEKRFDGVNEFRGALDDYTKTLAPRSEVATLKESMTKSLGEIEKRLERIDGRKEGMSVVTATMITVGSVIISLSGFLLLLWPHLK